MKVRQHFPVALSYLILIIRLMLRLDSRFKAISSRCEVAMKQRKQLSLFKVSSELPDQTLLVLTAISGIIRMFKIINFLKLVLLERSS